MVARLRSFGSLPFKSIHPVVRPGGESNDIDEIPQEVGQSFVPTE
jgi:hypothetical protein